MSNHLANFFFEKSIIPFESSSDSLFGLTPVKAFKAQNQQLINTIAYVVKDTSIQIYDPFGSLLDTYQFDSSVISVGIPTHPDEMYLSVLT